VEHLTYPPDFSAKEIELCNAVSPFTMTSPERIIALANLVTYIVERKIQGAIVECGVWRGGSMMTIATTLLTHSQTKRDLYLFDTFSGMAAPTDADVTFNGQPAATLLAKTPVKAGKNVWCIASIEDVSTNLGTTAYPESRIHLIKGKVEDTIPGEAPDVIALLRLDTDWYESTRHEFEHLYPRLVSGGVLIIDDYGHWKGTRKATDEYFAGLSVKPLLHRVDYPCRVCIKP